MMGMQAAPERLFYDFCLEDKVPADHLVRQIDRYLDLNDLRARLRPYYSRIGRPSVDPELMIRMLIVGYCFGIRSERRLCEEVDMNLAYRWFCGLGLDGPVPDHSTFSRNRHGRFRQSDLLRQVFEATVERAIAEGLVRGEGFAVDASLIQADANKQRSVPGEEWRINDIPADPGQAVKDYLATLDDAAFGAASEVTPKFVSPSDPAAQWTGPASRCAGWRTSPRPCGVAIESAIDLSDNGDRVSPSTVSNLDKKIYAKIEEWRNRPIEGEHPYVFLDGIGLCQVTFIERCGAPDRTIR